MMARLLRIIGSMLVVNGIYAQVLPAQEPALYQEEGGETPMVTLAALDKITTQLTTIVIRQNETVEFGTLRITLYSCRSNPPEETPESIAFLNIVDVGHNKKTTKIFSGWMFASSPALSPLEHPVYDVWVKDCKMVSGPALSDNE